MCKALLSEQQVETLNTYRRCVMEKKQAQLHDRFQRALESAEASEGSCPKREVTPVWRLVVADSRDQRGRGLFFLFFVLDVLWSYVVYKILCFQNTGLTLLLLFFSLPAEPLATLLGSPGFTEGRPSIQSL